MRDLRSAANPITSLTSPDVKLEAVRFTAFLN